MVPRTETHRAIVSPAAAALLAALALALFNLSWTAVEALASSGGPGRGAAAYLYDLLSFLAAGSIAAACLAVCSRIPWRPVRLVAIGLGVLAVVYLFITDDLSSFLDRRAPSHADTLRTLAALLIALVYTAFGALAPGVTNTNFRRIPVAIAGVGLMGVNGAILPLDYPGTHLLLALSGGLLVGVSVVHAHFRWIRPAQTTIAVLGIGATAFVVVVPPKNSTRVALVREETSSLAPYMTQLWARSEARALRGSGAFRRGATRKLPGLKLPPNAMVLMITIDALRADVPIKHPEKFPTLTRMANEGTTFLVARSAGSQTVYSLTSLFTSKYYSQQYWSKAPQDEIATQTRMGGGLWPLADKSVRFPERLTQSGVRTVNAASVSWLVNSVGVARGFSEEHFVKGKSNYSDGEQLTSHILDKLKAHDDKPLFLFAHYLDAHLPYNRAGKSGTPYERYLREVQLVDTELGKLWSKLVAAGYGDRLYWIVSADHGEAFGDKADHGAKSHGTTIYEEQLRVPLIFHGPKIPAQKIHEPVSQIDLAPTLIELFGLPEEDDYMGQSLAPFFLGVKPKLDRPILAETRLKKAYFTKDGLKAIVDDRKRTTEVYDLKVDPGETRNLADQPNGEAAVRQLREFFVEHRIRRPGYEPPYRY